MLLLTLWLSVIPTADARSAEAYRVLDLSAASAAADLIVPEVSVAEEAPAARSDTSDGSGPDEPDAVSFTPATAWLLASAASTGVPEATGPPAARPLLSYQARAPPLR